MSTITVAVPTEHARDLLEALRATQDALADTTCRPSLGAPRLAAATRQIAVLLTVHGQITRALALLPAGHRDHAP